MALYSHPWCDLSVIDCIGKSQKSQVSCKEVWRKSQASPSRVAAVWTKAYSAVGCFHMFGSPLPASWGHPMVPEIHGPVTSTTVVTLVVPPMYCMSPCHSDFRGRLQLTITTPNLQTWSTVVAISKLALILYIPCRHADRNWLQIGCRRSIETQQRMEYGKNSISQ